MNLNSQTINIIFTQFLLFFFIGVLKGDEITLEKVSFEFPKSFLHSQYHPKKAIKPDIKLSDNPLNKKQTETSGVEVVIPTIQPSSSTSWTIRAWESHHPFTVMRSLLELGISFQITHFFIDGNQFSKAKEKEKKSFLALAKEYKVKIIGITPKISIPIQSETVNQIIKLSQNKGLDGIFFKIDAPNILLKHEQGNQILDYLYKIINHKNQEIYISPFSSIEFFTKLINEFPKKPIPLINETAGFGNIVSPLNPQIKKEFDKKLIKFDISMREYGANKTLSILTEYYGLKLLQCEDFLLEEDGFLCNFGNSTLPFGTLNALNFFTLNYLILNKSADVDMIFYYWLKQYFNEELSVHLQEIIPLSLYVLKQTFFIKGKGVGTFNHNSFPVSLSESLTKSKISDWFQTSQKKTAYRNNWISEKKIALEQCDHIAEQFNNILKNHRSPLLYIAEKQIKKLKNKTKLFYLWAKILNEFEAKSFNIVKTKRLINELKLLFKTQNIESNKTNSLLSDLSIFMNEDKLIEKLGAEFPKENLPNAFIKTEVIND